MFRTEAASVGAGLALVLVATLACNGGAGKSDAGPGASASAASVTAPAASSAAKPTAGSVTDQAWVAGLVADLKKTATCPPKKPDFGDKIVLSGAWCAVGDFADGERDGALDDHGVLLGFVVELSTDAPVAAAAKKPKFAALAVDKRSGDRFATISTFTDAQGDYATASQTVTDVIEGSPFMFRAEIPKKVWADATARSDKASSKLVALPNGWHFESPTTDIRKIGKAYYAIELTTPKSIRVGVFTDKGVEAK